MKRMLPMLLLLLAACGGGNGSVTANTGKETPSNQPSVPERPTPQESPELAELHRVAKEASEKFPELADWDATVDAMVTTHDGMTELATAGSIAESLRGPFGKEEEVQWRFLLNDHYETFEDTFGRTPFDREREHALKMSDQIPVLLQKLGRRQSLVVFSTYLRNEAATRGTIGPLISANRLREITLHRAWLLAELQREDEARRELLALMRVLSLLDVDTCLASYGFGVGTYELLVRGLLESEHPQIITSPEVSKAVSELGNHLLQAQRKAWRMEFSWSIQQGLQADENYNNYFGDPVDGIRELTQALKYQVEIAEAFSGGPDFANATERSKAVDLADKLDLTDDKSLVFHWANAACRVALYDLAWEFYCQDREQPLLDRKQFVTRKIEEVPELKAVWAEGQLEIGYDEATAFGKYHYRNYEELRFIPMTTIKLQPSTE
ncbi:MAG: hypothetical protein R3E76_04875 [Planctomycetota bacterium]